MIRHFHDRRIPCLEPSPSPPENRKGAAKRTLDRVLG